MEKELVAKNFAELCGAENIRIDEPLKNHTSFRVGGPADIIVFPDDFNKLSLIVKKCKSDKIPFFILGNGTNLIVRDKGFRGIVIKVNEKLNKYSVEGDRITAEAGILLSQLSKVALKYQLSGLEFASGIPGTLGGAVIMNAGAYGGEMKDVVVKTHYLDTHGDIRIISGEEHRFGYRTSLIGQENGIVIKSEMKFRLGNREEIKARMHELDKKEN